MAHWLARRLARRAIHRATLALLCVAFASPAVALAVAPPSPAQGEDTHDEHAPSWHDINWYHGMLGERAGVPESLWWRAPGRPAPFAALALNSAILFSALYVFGRKPVQEALKKRKARIMHGMEEAARMKAEAERRLLEYEEKLERINHEILRVQREMREAGEAERVRVLREARERRQRMERDALLLIEQELKAARDQLYRETVATAIRSAFTTLTDQVSVADQQRLAREYLAELGQRAEVLRGKA
jgi:F-type H+-transporting ATPase subunit b